VRLISKKKIQRAGAVAAIISAVPTRVIIIMCIYVVDAGDSRVAEKRGQGSRPFGMIPAHGGLRRGRADAVCSLIKRRRFRPHANEFFVCAQPHQLVDFEAKINQVRYQLACRRVISMLITPPPPPRRACSCNRGGSNLLIAGAVPPASLSPSFSLSRNLAQFGSTHFCVFGDTWHGLDGVEILIDMLYFSSLHLQDKLRKM
jgi:hypothetical protein